MTELYGYKPILRIEMESFVNPEISRHLRSLRRALATGPATAIVLLFGANLLLAGCAALPPKANLKPISAPQTFAADKSLAAPSGDWPSDNWWNGLVIGFLAAWVLVIGYLSKQPWDEARDRWAEEFCLDPSLKRRRANKK